MFDSQEFLVQLGTGTERLAKDAVDGGYSDGVIISPISANTTTARGIAEDINNAGGTVLFDPQFYYPRSDDYNLQSYQYFSDYGGTAPEHEFWDASEGFDTNIFEVPDRRRDFCEAVYAYQKSLDVDAYIAPARMLNSFTDSHLRLWKDLTQTFLRVVEDKSPGIDVFGSLPLNIESLREKPQRANLLNWITMVDVDGFYCNVDIPTGNTYPLTGSEEVYSYLNLVKNLKVNRYEVLLGYSHHIAHLFLAIGADAFAAGNHKKTRRFDKEDWEGESGSGGQQIIRYYSDKIINELRVRAPTQEGKDGGIFSELDLLRQQGFDLEKIRMHSPFEEDLFRHDLPSESEWPNQGGAWNHYLWCCYDISRQYHASNLLDGSASESELANARIAHVIDKLEDAEELYEEMTESTLLRDPEGAIYNDWSDAVMRIQEELRR